MFVRSLLATMMVFASQSGFAHDWHARDAKAELIRVDNTAGAQECMRAVSNATIECGSNVIVIESNGLPDHQMMVGVKSGGWNGQWPQAQDYTGNNAYTIPAKPALAAQPTLTVRNAAGVAANGVPIFFPHAPGREGSSECLDISIFEGRIVDQGCLRDPVAVGEMDNCGGHTGRGNDYHYHGTPTCMLEKLEEGEIAGYMLDGLPIYATAIEGSKPYAKCGGYISPAGEIHYAFTPGFPYVTACMLGTFDEGPRTRGSNVYTGGLPRNAGDIVGFIVDEKGCQQMQFSSGSVLNYCP